jgi:peptidoglycan hydrolase CwlO-like protein
MDMLLNFIISILIISTLLLSITLKKALSQIKALNKRLNSLTDTHKNLEGDINLLLNMANFAEVTTMAKVTLTDDERH